MVQNFYSLELTKRKLAMARRLFVVICVKTFDMTKGWTKAWKCQTCFRTLPLPNCISAPLKTFTLKWVWTAEIWLSGSFLIPVGNTNFSILDHVFFPNETSSLRIGKETLDSSGSKTSSNNFTILQWFARVPKSVFAIKNQNRFRYWIGSLRARSVSNTKKLTFQKKKKTDSWKLFITRSRVTSL